MTDPTATAEASSLTRTSETSRSSRVGWAAGQSWPRARTFSTPRTFRRSNIPTAPRKAFYYMWRYSENLRPLYETPAAADDAHGEIDREKAAAIIAEVRKSGRTILTEFESKKLLAAYGIPTVETHIALTENDAVKQAARLGFPVVLKLYSETITHKTDVGGVQLNLRTASAVRQAWKAIETSVRQESRQGTFPRRHRAADDQAGRLRIHHRQQHGSAIRPGAAVRHRRPVGGSVQGPRARPAAAQRHARAPHDGAHQDLHRAQGRARPQSRQHRRARTIARALQPARRRAAVDRGNRHQSRCSSPPNASSRSTPAWCCTTPRPRKTSCPSPAIRPYPIQYVQPVEIEEQGAGHHPPHPARRRAADGQVPRNACPRKASITAISAR